MLFLHEFFIARVKGPSLPVTALSIFVLLSEGGREEREGGREGGRKEREEREGWREGGEGEREEREGGRKEVGAREEGKEEGGRHDF